MSIKWIGLGVVMVIASIVLAQSAPRKVLPSRKIAVKTSSAKPKPSASNNLPTRLYNTLQDSCTQIDVVFTAGTSMSLDGRSVHLFSSFVVDKPAVKQATPKAGFLMWQIQGREFITGDIYFTGDSTGYLSFTHEGHEYLNSLSRQGAAFLKSRAK
jgi:hypothetical protein